MGYYQIVNKRKWKDPVDGKYKNDRDKWVPTKKKAPLPPDPVPQVQPPRVFISWIMGDLERGYDNMDECRPLRPNDEMTINDPIQNQVDAYNVILPFAPVFEPDIYQPGGGLWSNEQWSYSTSINGTKFPVFSNFPAASAAVQNPPYVNMFVDSAQQGVLLGHQTSVNAYNDLVNGFTGNRYFPVPTHPVALFNWEKFLALTPPGTVQEFVVHFSADYGPADEKQTVNARFRFCMINEQGVPVPAPWSEGALANLQLTGKSYDPARTDKPTTYALLPGEDSAKSRNIKFRTPSDPVITPTTYEFFWDSTTTHLPHDWDIRLDWVPKLNVHNITVTACAADGSVVSVTTSTNTDSTDFTAEALGFPIALNFPWTNDIARFKVEHELEAYNTLGNYAKGVITFIHTRAQPIVDEFLPTDTCWNRSLPDTSQPNLITTPLSFKEGGFWPNLIPLVGWSGDPITTTTSLVRLDNDGGNKTRLSVGEGKTSVSVLVPMWGTLLAQDNETYQIRINGTSYPAGSGSPQFSTWSVCGTTYDVNRTDINANGSFTNFITDGNNRVHDLYNPTTPPAATGDTGLVDFKGLFWVQVNFGQPARGTDPFAPRYVQYEGIETTLPSWAKTSIVRWDSSNLNLTGSTFPGTVGAFSTPLGNGGSVYKFNVYLPRNAYADFGRSACLVITGVFYVRALDGSMEQAYGLRQDDFYGKGLVNLPREFYNVTTNRIEFELETITGYPGKFWGIKYLEDTTKSF